MAKDSSGKYEKKEAETRFFAALRGAFRAPPKQKAKAKVKKKKAAKS